MFKYTTRKDGRLMKRVSVDGKIKTLYSDNPKDLERQYIEIKHLSNKGIVADDNSLTIGNWADKWLKAYKEDKEQATKKMYSDAIRLYIKPKIGNIRLKVLKENDIITMLNTLNTKPRQKEIVLLTTKQILDKAVDNDYIYKNVANNIKISKHTAKEKKPLTELEINYLKKVSDIDNRCFMPLFMLYTGLRREEVAPLLYKDIDTKNWLVSINKAVHWEKNRPQIKVTKNRSERNLPILEVIQKRIKKMKKEHKDNELVFPSVKSKKIMTESSIKRALEHTLVEINKLYKKDQLDKLKTESNNDQDTVEIKTIKFTYHQLRHTYASLLHKAGISPKEAQYLTGHNDIRTLLDIYTHLDQEDKEKTKKTLLKNCII